MKTVSDWQDKVEIVTGKSCPRCRGDIFIDRDLDGWYEQCLQCSYRRELKDLAEFKKETAKTGGTRPKK